MLFSIASPEAEIKPLQMWALMIAFLQMKSKARLIFNSGKFSIHFFRLNVSLKPRASIRLTFSQHSIEIFCLLCFCSLLIWLQSFRKHFEILFCAEILFHCLSMKMVRVESEVFVGVGRFIVNIPTPMDSLLSCELSHKLNPFVPRNFL